jgi:hypothetical protein
MSAFSGTKSEAVLFGKPAEKAPEKKKNPIVLAALAELEAMKSNKSDTSSDKSSEKVSEKSSQKLSVKSVTQSANSSDKNFAEEMNLIDTCNH